MRSGFVAGDAAVIAKFALYRTYHGSAMNPTIQAASIAAWCDETHVAENRRLYAENLTGCWRYSGVLPITLPDASFYLWITHTACRYRLRAALYRDIM